jgi:hypothetical protein
MFSFSYLLPPPHLTSSLHNTAYPSISKLNSHSYHLHLLPKPQSHSPIPHLQNALLQAHYSGYCLRWRVCGYFEKLRKRYFTSRRRGQQLRLWNVPVLRESHYVNPQAHTDSFQINIVDSDGSVTSIVLTCVTGNTATCGSGCVLQAGPTSCTNSLKQAGGYCATFLRCADQHVADAGGRTSCLHGSTATCAGMSCVAC